MEKNKDGQTLKNKNQDGNISRCMDSRIKIKMGISLDVRTAE